MRTLLLWTVVVVYGMGASAALVASEFVFLDCGLNHCHALLARLDGGK